MVAKLKTTAAHCGGSELRAWICTLCMILYTLHCDNVDKSNHPIFRQRSVSSWAPSQLATVTRILFSYCHFPVFSNPRTLERPGNPVISLGKFCRIHNLRAAEHPCAESRLFPIRTPLWFSWLTPTLRKEMEPVSADWTKSPLIQIECLCPHSWEAFFLTTTSPSKLSFRL